MRLLRISALMILFCAATARASDWTNWRGPFQTGYSPETGLPSTWSPDGDNLVWKAPVGCRSTPIVMKGRVFLLNYTAEKSKDASGEVRDKTDSIRERIMCLDAATGKTLWEHTFPVFHTDIVTVRLGWTNLVADPATGYVYAHGTQGLLLCLDGMADQPKVVWQKSLTEEYGRISGYGGRVTSPVLFEDLVIIGLVNSSWGDHAKGGNRFVAFEKKTGAVRWWSEPAGAVKDTYFSVPVTAKIGGVDLLISGGADGSVFAMKARTGEPVWRYAFGSAAVNCSPVVSGSHVFIGQGEENLDNNVQGRFICLDAAKVENGEPKLVWKRDGITVRYTSPIVHEGRLYVTNEVGELYCLDTATGEQHWKFSYGRNSRGSPVLADGKIYVGDVNSKFFILQPGEKKCKKLSQTFFQPQVGSSNVEVNGSPAVAEGCVFFSTSDETYCIASGGKAAKAPSPPVLMKPGVKAAPGPVAFLQIVPGEVAVHPGETVKFEVRGFDASGNFVKTIDDAVWSLPAPPLPPKAKSAPPPLEGKIEAGVLTIDSKKPAQQGYVAAKLGDLVGKARVRVAPRLPYVQDFAKVPDGAVPAGWINTQGKFVVDTIDGQKVLRKVNNNASPLVARGNGYIALPTEKNYTIECDVQGTKKGDDLPDVGIVANRYTLYFAGNVQKLRLVSWDALPRVDQTIPFKFEPGVWYHMKLTTEFGGGKGLVKGKVWPKGQPEPAAWTVQLNDPHPILEGSPAVYGYVTGIAPGGAGTDIYYANLKVTPN